MSLARPEDESRLLCIGDVHGCAAELDILLRALDLQGGESSPHVYRRADEQRDHNDGGSDSSGGDLATRESAGRLDEDDEGDQACEPEPSRSAGWLTPTLGALAAVLALVAGVAVLAARRAWVAACAMPWAW